MMSRFHIKRLLDQIDHLKLLIVQRDERIRILEQREWLRYEAGDRPVAMPAPGPDPDAGFMYLADETGLVVERVARDAE